MTIYYKQNDSWVRTLQVMKENTWLHQHERKSIISRIEEGLTEEEAERLCKKYDDEIESRIATWQMYQ